MWYVIAFVYIKPIKYNLEYVVWVLYNLTEIYLIPLLFCSNLLHIAKNNIHINLRMVLGSL